MKKALLLFGHMRTFQRCYESLYTNLLYDQDFDIFIHTWDENESTTKSWHSNHAPVKKFSPREKNYIKSLYQPKDIIIEPQTILDYTSTCPGNLLNIEGQKNMVKSLYLANKLKQNYELANNFTYDLVIKLRPDILLYNSLSPLINRLDLSFKKFHLGGNPSSASVQISSYRALDIIGISNSPTMDIACGVFKEFEKFYIKSTFFHSAYVDYLLDKQLNLNLTQYDYGPNWTILRHNN